MNWIGLIYELDSDYPWTNIDGTIKAVYINDIQYINGVFWSPPGPRSYCAQHISESTDMRDRCVCMFVCMYVRTYLGR